MVATVPAPVPTTSASSSRRSRSSGPSLRRCCPDRGSSQGVIAGIGAAIGYGLGCIVSWLVRTTPLRERGPVFKHRAWIALAVVAPLYAVVSLLLGVGWQNEVRTLVGRRTRGSPPRSNLLWSPYPWRSVAGCSVVRCAGSTAGSPCHLGRFIPRPVAWTGAVVIIGLLIYVAVTGVAFRGFVGVMNNIYAGANASTKDGITQPTSALRWGSRPSFSAWEHLGMKGRNFVALPPNSTQI